MKLMWRSRVLLRIRTHALQSVCVLIAVQCLAMAAQVSPPPSQWPAKKPADCLKTAAQINGLEADGIGPWHLKATFTLFDALGNPKDRGTYEMLWVNRQKRRGSIESAEFSQAWILNGTTNVTLSGSRNRWPDLLSKMFVGFIHPIYEDEDHDLEFSFEKTESGNLPIRCVDSVVSEAMNPLNRAMSKSTLCFDAAKPLLLLRIDAFGIKTIRENIFRFQGRYIARDLTVIRDGRVYLKAHLESLDELNPVDEKVFIVPPPQRKTYLAYRTTEEENSLQIRKVKPEYPAEALAERVSGVVHVKAEIDLTGHVTDVLALDGPPLLQEAALKAVRQYSFKPYVVNDARFIVVTVFPVEYTLPAAK